MEILGAVPGRADAFHQIIGFDQLLGWEADDHAAALSAFTKSCRDIRAPEWQPICAFAETGVAARTFFESFFTPVIIHPESKALFTGYFEPELRGSRVRTDTFKYPIYRKPKNMKPGDPALTRAAIDNGALRNQGLEIAWVDDPVEAYYLHIQGSGRINLPDGASIRVGYAGENGHVYRSAARELIRQGQVSFSESSIAGIRAWVRKNPLKGRKILQHNASYVFFRELNDAAQQQGPFGALDRPITAMRTIAVDPKYTQMGAPVWVEKGGRAALRRLMVAQDVGAAIKGPQRADIFFGTGDDAGQMAGQTRNGGRMVVLLPIGIANRLAGISSR